MEIISEENQTQQNQISIDVGTKIEELRQEWKEFNYRNSKRMPAIPLSYPDFKNLLVAFGSKYLVSRGESIKFEIFPQNEDVIFNIYRYFRRDSSFVGDLNKGILLNGAYGTGKTTLMNAIMGVYNYCTELDPDNRFALKMRIMKSDKIVEEYWKEDNQYTLNGFLNGLLVIDELGREQKEIMIYGNSVRPITSLLHDRYDRGRTTFAISNFTMSNLASDNHYGKMIGDRLRQMFNEITLKGDSLRK